MPTIPFLNLPMPSRTWAFFLLLVPLFLGCPGKSREPSTSEVTSRPLAPEVDILLQDRTLSLASLRGKVVVLNFWATWCPPCVEEFPSLLQLKYALWGKPFEILAISVDDGGFPDIQKFTTGRVINILLGSDPEERLARQFGVEKYPETFIIDRAGRLVEKIVGPRNWAAPELVSSLHALLEQED